MKMNAKIVNTFHFKAIAHQVFSPADPAQEKNQRHDVQEQQERKRRSQKNPVPPVGSPSAREGDKGGEGASKIDMMYKSDRSASTGRKKILFLLSPVTPVSPV